MDIQSKTPSYLLLIVILLGFWPAWGQEFSDFNKIKSRYANAPILTDEIVRENYINDLAYILINLGEKRDKQGHPLEDKDEKLYAAIAAEMNRYPYPSNVSSAELSRQLIGQWEGARHETEYRADETSQMIDGVDCSVPWKIKGNSFVDNKGVQTSTIILINKNIMIYGNGKDIVFLSKRMHKNSKTANQALQPTPIGVAELYR